MNQNELDEIKQSLQRIEEQVRRLAEKQEKRSRFWIDFGYDFFKAFFVVLGLLFIGFTLYGLFRG